MNTYFQIITWVDLFVLLFMSIHVLTSETLDTRQKDGLLLLFPAIALLALLELTSAWLTGQPAPWRFVSYAVHGLIFGLSLSIPIIMVCALDRRRSIRSHLIACGILFLLLAITVPFGLLFRVGSGAQAVSGTYFRYYIVVYLFAVLYLLVSTAHMGKRQQHRGKFLIYPVNLFLVWAVCRHLFSAGEYPLSWYLSVLSLLYFIYINEMWQQLDGLTGLLSQKSYINRTASIRREMLLIVFDVDDFKTINDHHGHVTGDQVLMDIADCIRQAYASFGYCYRIGGDEFCVLLEVPGIKLPCYSKFIKALEAKRIQQPLLPFVSVGTAVFSPGDNILDVKEQADQELYHYKVQHKRDRANGIFDDGSLYDSKSYF